MKIHEFQAKALMKSKGIVIPIGTAVRTPGEAVAAVRPVSEQSGSSILVVKAQIHAGGRGKGRFKEHPELSGVVVVTDAIEGGIAAAEARIGDLATKMLGSTLVTIQTGNEGKQVNRLYIEQGIDIARELYVSVLLDRAMSRSMIMCSTEGGADIEEVAASMPEKILRVRIDPAFGLLQFQAARLASGLGLSGATARSGARFMKALSDAAVDLDADLVEINPLVVTIEGEVMALDGKMSFEPNALYRHPDVVGMRDVTEEDPAEVEAEQHGLSFIKLGGDIGCMVNGAGLAMATMDIIKYFGGEPANFLDVGGGATAEKITEAFKIITHASNVKGIFVNIFGGIMRCDTIALGMVEAVREVGLKVPLVVRLEGTNVDLGKRIISDADLGAVTAEDMKDGAQKIVAAVRARS